METEAKDKQMVSPIIIDYAAFKRFKTIEAFFLDLTQNYMAGDWNDIDACDYQDLMEKHGITEKRFPERGTEEYAEWGDEDELHYIKEEFLP